MGRFCVIFATLLMGSAISLVTARFQSRELFVVSDRLSSKTHDLDNDWRRLQLERAELARNARIDQTARDELKMVSVPPGQTIYLDGDAPVSVAAAPVPAPAAVSAPVSAAPAGSRP
jgi:cell division protein FtsL